MNVLLLSGGKSNEREVSLRSGNSVKEALIAAGHQCKIADPAEPDFDIRNLVNGIKVVFPVLHGAGGEDGVLQRELEDLGIPFVGSGSEASALCFDKWRYKQFLSKNSLPASKGRLISRNDMGIPEFQKPFVLKPFDGGSSLDTLIIRTIDDQSVSQAAELLQKYPQMLLEPLTEGSEITVGIFDNEALPIIEIIPPENGDFDYENKYNGATQELCPPVNVSIELQKQAQNIALKIHELTGCRHMSRTDIMIDSNNILHVLETNTIPGLTDQSLLPKMVREAGYSMPQFVDRLLILATTK
ncbi:D-alanine--D-alanine ligase [Candidatus Saccharibacteria bacterium]|nr:D-alanine--D-alanine ligase [Candidatus Saccharibacteria bacterium]